MSLKEVFIRRLLLAAIFCMSVLQGVSAQNTTASLSGTVKDNDANPIEAATVQLKGSDNGAFFGAVTNRNGIFSISGIKPGLYKIKASFIGYESQERDSLLLSVGADYIVDFVLAEESQNIGEVVIVASSTIFNQVRTGQTYNIDKSSIELLPSGNRSILDYTKLSPYSGLDNSMAGRDGRGTSLTIDGAVMNNSFGLSASLPGAGTPISIEAVQEMQVAIAPYDVRQSNYTGGGINVITKSGTNRHTGSLYGYMFNERMRGNRVAGESLGERESERRRTFGLSLGGPIIKDKLFYYVNAESESMPEPISEWKLSQDGIPNAGNLTSRVTAADMEQFKNALMAYGYDAGSYDLSSGDQTNFKLLVRLDWNISQNNNLMVRFNRTANSEWNTPNGRSTVGVKAASERISQNAYAFRNNCYTIRDKAWSGVAELNSRMGGNMSNKLLMTVSDVSNMRNSGSSWFPHIDIRKDGDAFMSAGYELFSNGTGNYVRTYSVADHLRWTIATTTMTAGLSYQYQSGATNYRMYGTGYYRYASLDDFMTQSAPVAFGMTYTYDGVDDPASRTSFGQSAAFMQAESRIRDNFTITYGIRADLMQYYGELSTNQSFKNLDWTTHFKAVGTESADYKSPVIDNGRWPETNVQWSPRLGFNWDVHNDGRFVLHGGAGLFTGRIPLVFFTTIPNSSGMLQNTVMFTKPNDDPTAENSFLDGLAGNFQYTERALLDYLKQNGCNMRANPNPLLKGASITGIEQDFKLPQVFKVSFAADYEFDMGFPLSVSVEGIWNKDINAVYVENYNQVHADCMGRFQGTDNRIDYHDALPVNSVVSNSGGAMVLRNTNLGYSWSLGTIINARPIKGMNVEVAYTHMEAMSVQDMMGSSLSSTWSNTPNVNSPNEMVLRPSAYVIPDKLTASLTYRVRYATNKSLGTGIGISYTGHTGGLYSYTYSNDMNGDGVVNDLIWIPESTGELWFDNIKDKNGTVLYTAEEQREAFKLFVEQDPYLIRHLGEYAAANRARMPWLNRFDLHIEQDLYMANLPKLRLPDYTCQITFDIMNVGNLLNSNWGVTQTPSGCNGGQILRYERSANGRPIYTLATNGQGLITNTFQPLKSTAECWYMQLGFRLIFN